MTDEQLLDDVIRREGKRYTNLPSDRGGPTKFGITLETLREERGASAMAEDVAALTEAEARDIYRRRYIRRPGFDRIPDERLRGFLIDFGINSGPKRAIKALQNAIGAAPDGVIGPDTLRRLTLGGFDPSQVYGDVLRARLRLYGNRALNTPAVKAFLKTHPSEDLHNLAGWLNRFGEFL